MISADKMFRAFADGTRLRILHLLSKGEMCVCDIMAILKAPQPKISRHLGYLKRAGLVQVRTQGLWRYYSLAKPASRFQKGLIECLGGCFPGVPILARDAARLKKQGRTARC